jgi:hypothetical protein
LGLSYVAAYLRAHGVSVNIVDCTFMDEKDALERIRKSKPAIVGVQAMF